MSFLPVCVDLFILCPPFVVLDACNYTFCQSEGVNIKRPNYANRPAIRGICLRWDLLSLTCICLCAVFSAPGLHLNRPACPQDCMRFNHQHWSWRDASEAGGGGWRFAQQHQITNNFSICIFLRMARHLSLMHLPVHPEGVAKLKKP